jgi:hypothetical protein
MVSRRSDEGELSASAGVWKSGMIPKRNATILAPTTTVDVYGLGTQPLFNSLGAVKFGGCGPLAQVVRAADS